MYNVQVDENMFFTGTYAKVGSVQNGVNVDKLPPSENALCYKLVDVTVTESHEEPVLQYIAYKESETEFVKIYTLTTVDEDGNEVQTSITEEEYAALTEDEKTNVEVSEIPVVDTVELTKEEYEALDDSERSRVIVSYKSNEDGSLMYETVTTTKTIKDWEFSQEKYDELEAIKAQKEIEAEENRKYQESISNETLKAENQMLTEQVTMLDETLAVMLEEILPSLMGE